MSRRRRDAVVVISQVPPPVHGSAVMTQALLVALEEQGREPVLVDRRFSRSVSDIGRVDGGKVLRGIGLIARLARAVVVRRPSTAILFTTNRPASFLVDVVLTGVLRAGRVPTVHYLHTNGFRDLAARGRVWRVLVGYLLHGSEHVVCLGETLVDDITPWVDRSRVRIIPNASPAAPASTEAPQADDAPVTVLFMSNLLPEKGAHTAVDVGVQLAGEGSDVRVVLAGADADEAYSASLRGKVAQAGLEERIRLIGAVQPKDRPALMDEADLLLFPSTYPYEAQPLTIVESMAAGLPVVAYDVGGVPDVVESGHTGELVRLGDTGALTDTVRRLVEDRRLRRSQGDAARERHERDHTPAAFREAWRAVLEDVDRA